MECLPESMMQPLELVWNGAALEKLSIPVAEIKQGRKKIASEGPGKLLFANKPDSQLCD